MRVFLDANILFSAAKSDGAVRGLLKSLRPHGHVLVADGFVAEEARRNLARKGAADALDSLHALLTVVELAAVRSHAAESWLDWLPAKDRPVLAAAVALRCDVLMTGDRKHFSVAYGERFEGVAILSPAMVFSSLL